MTRGKLSGRSRRYSGRRRSGRRRSGRHSQRRRMSKKRSSERRLYRATGSTMPCRIGVVSFVKRMPNEYWFKHHRNLGVVQFYMSVEAPLTREVTPTDVAIYSRPEKSFGYEFWTEQEAHVNDVIPEARRHGVTHLLHIDDDELLYFPQGRAAFDEHVSSHLCSSARCLVLRNFEAVAPHVHVASPFSECFFFRTDPSTYTAYANGKSLGVLSQSDLKGDGAHRFRGTFLIDDNIAVILHYESMVVEAWKEKFKRMARSRDQTHETAPIAFQFYIESLDAVKRSDPIETWTRFKIPRPTETLRHIHPSFVGPSIILVGNGPSLRDVDISVFVDAFPIVVRFNEFLPTERLGRKTNVWCVSDTVAVKSDSVRPADRVLCIIPSMSPFAHTPTEVANSLRRCSNVTIHESSRSSKTTWPSTGLLALEYFLSSYPASAIFVCGFDHFKTVPIHHYDDGLTSNHASSSEAHLFQQLSATNGRVFRLPQ